MSIDSLQTEVTNNKGQGSATCKPLKKKTEERLNHFLGQEVKIVKSSTESQSSVAFSILEIQQSVPCTLD